jgi:hypothetical protein
MLASHGVIVRESSGLYEMSVDKVVHFARPALLSRRQVVQD